jgi:sigma-B regulation protein RsbU (phosphoserine phosphatase)
MNGTTKDQAGENRLASVIRAEGALADLSPAALDRLCTQSTQRSFQEGEIILAQGGESDYALVIVSGEVQIVVESRYGSIVVATLRAPCLIGELGALAGLARTATVRAATEVTALLVDRALLLDIARETPGLTLRVIGQLGNRIRQFNTAIGLYTHALAALEQNEFDPKLLDDLRNPVPDLAEFGQTFARIAEQIILRRQREDEMASAAVIQRALLPKPADVAAITAADLCASMTPAREVGGDFFDLIELDGDRLAIGIGDVCGKGMPAALFMGITKTLLRINIKSEPDFGRAIARTNDFLVNENATELFATLFYATFDPRSGTLDYCSCGHNPPFLRRADGTVQMLAAGGLPVGIFEGAKIKVQHEILAAGDLLFLYTDGVTEAFNTDKEEFGDKRLTALLREGPCRTAKGWTDYVVEAVRTFAAGAAQSDDITCFALVANEFTNAI